MRIITMTEELRSLGENLAKKIDEAPRKEQITSVYLFALENFEAINRYGIRKLVDVSGVKKGYIPELHKAMKLAPYIQMRTTIGYESREEEDVLYCGHCEEDTEQNVYSSGHERDSSGDWQKCHKCGYRYSGMTGEWEKDD